MTTRKCSGAIILAILPLALPSWGGLSIDRSRLIYNEEEKSVSIGVINNNSLSPYLAQAWLENENEEKISSPLVTLPPLQRVEPEGKTRVRLQALADIHQLPSDRESVFYFNLREIPARSDKPNALTLAVQSRLKVFYRPKALKVPLTASSVPGAETLTLTRESGRFVVHNPTPYHFTFVDVIRRPDTTLIANFDPVMVSPKSSQTLLAQAQLAGDSPALVFVNDYGSQMMLPFICHTNACQAGQAEKIPHS